MPAKIDLINQVLSEIGRPPITQVTNSDDAVNIIFARMDVLFAELLLRTDWNFQIKYVSLDTPLIPSFSPDFPFTYTLPSDFATFDRTSPQQPNFALYYRIIDGLLLCNVQPAQFYYVSNVIDYSIIPPLFEQALILYTAYRVCLVLTNNAQLTAYLKETYEDKLNDALRQNDVVRYIQSTPYNDFDRQTYI